MSAELAPQCWYGRPRVYRKRVSRSAVAYAAACHCGWRFESAGDQADAVAVRITAECEALLHYLPLTAPERLAEFRRLLPACRSAKQVEVVIDLLTGERVHPPAFGLSGKAARYRPSYTRAWSRFIARLRERGARLVFRTGPRGGVESGTYELVGVEP